MTMARRNPTTQMERRIESALAPGRFISYNVNFEFLRELEAAEKQIARTVPTKPDRAASLYESFLAGCYAKADEIDDSSGSFGQFVGELFCGWTKARQAACADPDVTAARLLVWMDNDPYGFCYKMERNAAKVLDKAGLAAFEKLVRARFEAAGTAPSVPGQSAGRNLDYQRRRSSEMLRAVYINQKDVEAYATLCEATELTAQDCHALAKMMVARRKPEDALCWVERGLTLGKQVPSASKASYDLARLKCELLANLGRGDEAIREAWAEFCKHPSKYSYDDLMKHVPQAEYATWHKKAIEEAMGTDLDSLMQLLLETKELEMLGDLVGQSRDSALEAVSHYTTEPAAKRLEKTRPEIAARLWRAQGMRIVNAKKSKYYNAALENFQRARGCYEKAGLAADWWRVVNEVRAEHRRKTGFMPGFEEVAAGANPSKKRSFLERAKMCWAMPPAKDKQ
jgi:hypothetical protein